jgi:hypothetical protein
VVVSTANLTRDDIEYKAQGGVLSGLSAQGGGGDWTTTATTTAAISPTTENDANNLGNSDGMCDGGMKKLPNKVVTMVDNPYKT